MAKHGHEGSTRTNLKMPDGPKSGRIGRLDDQTLGYYRRVSDAMKEEFGTEEERGQCSNLILSPTVLTYELMSYTRRLKSRSEQPVV